MSRSASPTLSRGAVLAAALAVLVWVTHGSTTGLAMLGWDGWPLVSAGRIGSPVDLARTFGEELMDGRYPFGSFYRPVTHLSFGLDHALYGLNPAGYHRTDLVLFAIAAALVGALAASLGGRRPWTIGALAGALFVLHPIQLELLPVSPRRADVLALAFTLGALLLLPRSVDRCSKGRALTLALLGFAAGGSKETGVIVAPLAIAAGLWLWPRGVGRAAMMRSAFARATPVLAGTAAYVTARTLVLGGLGGHTGTAAADSTGVLARWTELAARTVYPEPIAGTLPALVAIAIGIAVASLAALAAGCRDTISPTEAPTRPFAFLCAWTACVLAITTLADRFHEWYAMLLAVPWVVLLASAIAAGIDALRPPRRLPIAASALAVVLAGSHVLASPLLREYRLLEAASEVARRTYAQIERDLGDATPGTVREIQWIPMIAPNEDGSDVSALHICADYTIQAWCELRWPDAEFVVDYRRGRSPIGIPGKVHVQLVPVVEPRWVREFR